MLLNSHGGNELKSVLRELHGRTPAHLFLCNWYTVCQDIYSEIFERPDNHAGEMETSMALAYCPELVAHNPDGSLAADEGRVGGNPFRGGQPRLGHDHPPLAPVDHEHGRGQSARRHGREGPPADGDARRSSGDVPGGAFRGEGRRAVSVLSVPLGRLTVAQR